MQVYEFKVVPAPRKGEKARGLKTTADRFAHALALVMNDLAREGWEYLRADTLPCEERSGLTSKVTTYQAMLVFRRPVFAPPVAEPVMALAPPAEGPVAGLSAVAVEPVAAAVAPRLGSALAEEGAAPQIGPAAEGAR